ncbi:MAG: glutamate racemase [Myxococcota bacterium]
MTRPIGVFDSGLGGLTVAAAVRRRLPEEAVVYLGDTARVPYGTRSRATVIRYARSCARKLVAHDIKLLVVACNTVSAVALDMLRVELDIPVLGVIGPGARAGVAASRRGRLGVIATAGTVGSGAYTRAVAAEDTRAEVFGQAAPLLVPLVEDGWLTGEVPRLCCERYLAPLAAREIDALILGCTHYPLLRGTVEEVLEGFQGETVPVVDSAEATAEELVRLMDERELRADHSHGSNGRLTLLVTDLPGRFAEVASRFLGAEVASDDVTLVDL